MKRLAKTIAMLSVLLGIKEIPIEGGKSNFSDDQKDKMKEKMGEELAQKTIDAIDKEATNILKEQQKDEDLSAIRQELATALEGTNADVDTVIEAVEEGTEEGESLSAEVRKLATALIESNKRNEELVQKLINDPEGDSPEARGSTNPNANMQHSNTHLLASGKGYDAFEGRNWNKQAAGLSSKPTDWAAENGINIDKLNNDLDHYFREDPTVVQSLIRDRFGLPSHWDKKMGVTDQVADATIVSGEITQARKLPWLAKNKQKIQAEIGKVWPVQVDIEFIGKQLQDYEASWLSKFVGGGSQPYKMSFVGFLLQELSAQARIEDRISSIKGIHVATPDNATTPGRFINRQDGLLYQFWYAYNYKKQYKIANVGTPTNENILDHVKDVIEKNIPEEVRSNTPLDFYMSEDWARAYARRYRQLHGVEMDFTGNVWNIELYPNIRFEILHDLAGTNFMFITTRDNIQILENIPEEKSMYHFDMIKRVISAYADYKQGIRAKHIGNKVKDGDPAQFKVQTIWTNGQPFFSADTFVPAHDDQTGELNVKYSNMQVAPEWKTDITEINNTYTGQVLKIRGNASMAASKNVKNNSDLLLASDFDLSSGGTLTLYVQADGKKKELSRTTEPDVTTPDPVNFMSTVIDAADGSDQNYTGTTDQTLSEIINGTEGQELSITGNDTGSFTVSNIPGNVAVGSDAVLATATDTISFVLVDGVWMETSRDIAPGA